MEDIFDQRDSFNRIGDRTLNSWKHEFQRHTALVILLVCFIIGLAYYICKAQQEYIQSFAKTRVEMVTKFYPLEGVPTWKLIVTNDHEAKTIQEDDK